MVREPSGGFRTPVNERMNEGTVMFGDLVMSTGQRDLLVQAMHNPRNMREIRGLDHNMLSAVLNNMMNHVQANQSGHLVEPRVFRRGDRAGHQVGARGAPIVARMMHLPRPRSEAAQDAIPIDQQNLQIRRFVYAVNRLWRANHEAVSFVDALAMPQGLSAVEDADVIWAVHRITALRLNMMMDSYRPIFHDNDDLRDEEYVFPDQEALCREIGFLMVERSYFTDRGYDDANYQMFCETLNPIFAWLNAGRNRIFRSA